MTDEHRTIRARRLAARDALGIPRSPRHDAVPTDTGIVHGPRHWYETDATTSGARSGWDAVPDTRDVRPEWHDDDDPNVVEREERRNARWSDDRDADAG